MREITQLKRWAAIAAAIALGLQPVTVTAQEAVPGTAPEERQAAVLTIEEAGKEPVLEPVPYDSRHEDSLKSSVIMTVSNENKEDLNADGKIDANEGDGIVVTSDPGYAAMGPQLLKEVPADVAAAVSRSLGVSLDKLEMRAYKHDVVSCKALHCRTGFFSVDVALQTGDTGEGASHFVAWVETGGSGWNYGPFEQPYQGGDVIGVRAPEVHLIKTPIDVEGVHAIASAIPAAIKGMIIETISMAMPRCIKAPCPAYMAEINVKVPETYNYYGYGHTYTEYTGTITKIENEEGIIEYQVELKPLMSPEMRAVQALVRDDLVNHYGLDKKLVDAYIKDGQIKFELAEDHSTLTVTFSDWVQNTRPGRGEAMLTDLMGEGVIPAHIDYELGRSLIVYAQADAGTAGSQAMIWCPTGDCPTPLPNFFIKSARYQVENRVFNLDYLPKRYTDDGIVALPVSGDNRLKRVSVEELAVCQEGMMCAALYSTSVKTIEYYYDWNGGITALLKPGVVSDRLASMKVTFDRFGGSSLYIKSVTDLNMKGEAVAVSTFDYMVAMPAILCVEGSVCGPVEPYVTLNSITRTAKDEKGALLSTTTFQGDSALVKIGDVTTSVMFKNLTGLLDEIRLLEEKIQNAILAQIGFGSMGRVIVEKVTKDGVEKHIVKVQVIAPYMTAVWPPRTVYTDLAEFELKDAKSFEVIPGLLNSWYSREGLKIVTSDGRTITFWNTLGQFARNQSAYYIEEKPVHWGMYGELKYQATHTLHDNWQTGSKLLLASEMLMKPRAYSWGGTTYTSYDTVEYRNYTYKDGLLTSKATTRRADDGSSLSLTENFNEQGVRKLAAVTVYKPGKGIVLKNVQVTKLETVTEPGSGILLELKGFNLNPDGSERQAFKILCTKQTIQVEAGSNAAVASITAWNGSATAYKQPVSAVTASRTLAR